MRDCRAASSAFARAKSRKMPNSRKLRFFQNMIIMLKGVRGLAIVDQFSQANPL